MLCPGSTLQLWVDRPSGPAKHLLGDIKKTDHMQCFLPCSYYDVLFIYLFVCLLKLLLHVVDYVQNGIPADLIYYIIIF